jgi:NTE family protein
MLVDTGELGIVEFDAPAAKRARVLAKGEEAAREFLDGWDWDAYMRDCRS